MLPQIFEFLHEVCTTETLVCLYKQFLSLWSVNPLSQETIASANNLWPCSPLDKRVPEGWEVEHNYQPVNKKGNPDAAYRPDQHIYRMPTSDKPPKSRFNVNLDGNWMHRNPVSIPGLKTPLARPSYWNHYDILGLILSLLQSELDGADKDRFFLPLTAVYGRWCAEIGGKREATKPPIGCGAAPAVFQCTWVKDENDRISFALGSSLAGYDWNNECQVGDWKTRLRETRFDLLNGWNDIDKVEEKWAFQWSPLLEEKPEVGTHFGNCGETYPFLHIL